ncbi:Endonuclease/exonuclease/phosphatase [Rhodotorula diobovata]|uniref:DNA-(apurinic or apyrimidinic site) endonuclease n=1 Tax=Rhodotorula diobovata TaxID=5288 RepID=A0A5C5G229_9BASI|nr:Endonuclease/exonuclease/phosphatase [Rhodotorula diobovata]
MRIVTWNVNGIKTLPHFHPWNVKKTYEGVIEDLEGDIACIQETKITRAQIDKGMACMSAYDSFFSFYRKSVKGVHGTAIFTKRDVVVPRKAEEGIGSSLLPTTVPVDERIGGYPLSSDADLDYNTMKDLDAEGRTTVIDTGMFVLINLYCPNETNSDRLEFKLNFNRMVDRRVRGLVRAGREVIVVGDLNICASDLDTAEPEKRARESGLEAFTDHPARRWLNDFTGENGVMIDITRRLHPERTGMFTCWNTKIDARPTNYGARIDYILITPGLLPWVKDSDIQRDVMGSDHCPVYLDLHDSLDIPGRGTVSLWDELNPGRSRADPPPPPPAFAARFYDEFSGKQKLLSSFFGKKSAGPTPSPSPQPGTSSAPVASTSSSQAPASTAASASQPAMNGASSSSSSSLKNGKGKGKAKEPSPPAPPEKEKERKTGQQALSSFFKAPPKPDLPAKKKRKKSSSAKPTASKQEAGEEDESEPSSSAKPSQSPKPRLRTPPDREVLVLSDDDDDDGGNGSGGSGATRTARATTEEQADALASATASSSAALNAESASAWSSIFAPKPPPLCEGHNEPAKLWTVNKTGLNKGRRFFLCARPVGPGYDQGQAKLHVDPQFRCNFFQWETSVKRPAGIALTPSAKKKKTS